MSALDRLIDRAQHLFGNDWNRAIVCAWQAWDYISKDGTTFRRAWYIGLPSDERAEFERIFRADYERRLLEGIV